MTGSAAEKTAILKAADTVLVIDWPSAEVPETLAHAGLNVVIKGGPGPEDFMACVLEDGRAVTHLTGEPPERADVVYSFRPLEELPDIIASAKSLNARTIWTQSGLSAKGKEDAKGCWLPEKDLQQARNLVEAAGMAYVSEPYIADVARALKKS